jgi:hypothetical protein
LKKHEKIKSSEKKTVAEYEFFIAQSKFTFSVFHQHGQQFFLPSVCLVPWILQAVAVVPARSHHILITTIRYFTKH